MINAPKLMGRLKESNLSVEKLCAQIGMNQSTFYRKLKKEKGFTIGEIHMISDALSLSCEENVSIFLPWLSCEAFAHNNRFRAVRKRKASSLYKYCIYVWRCYNCYSKV